MSGGHFNYNQYKIQQMADDLEQLILDNNKENEYGYTRNYSDETIAEFKKGLHHLRMAFAYVHRIDWLVSDDDSEESFHIRLAREIEWMDRP